MAELWAPEEAREISCHDKKFNHHTDDSGEPVTAQKTNVVSIALQKYHFGGKIEDRWEGGKTGACGRN